MFCVLESVPGGLVPGDPFLWVIRHTSGLLQPSRMASIFAFLCVLVFWWWGSNQDQPPRHQVTKDIVRASVVASNSPTSGRPTHKKESARPVMAKRAAHAKCLY